MYGACSAYKYQHFILPQDYIFEAACHKNSWAYSILPRQHTHGEFLTPPFLFEILGITKNLPLLLHVPKWGSSKKKIRAEESGEMGFLTFYWGVGVKLTRACASVSDSFNVMTMSAYERAQQRRKE
ncbi:hypothetical protein AVEN_97740-1 [Araneus ventricosus]|uniref:Uncharacterized protein n=1 Tax=Araneus ventricosus TaxID=182803 RepID=A0A4Y2E5M0_ARAVE|nr:hypothetical protein AVEN_97740-1 [Araneus ventricosus]